MTAAVFFGCAFIAFGPAFSLFIFTIAKDPLRVIILIAGAFFWLVSLLLSSLVWFIATKATNAQDLTLQKNLLIFGCIFSVILQEVFRFAYYRLLRKANEGLAAISEEDGPPLSVREMAYVAGLGFGIMSGAFSMINTLSDSLGPGTVGMFGDSQYYFITSALMTLALTLLHTFWGVVFFEGCERKRWWVIAVVLCLHLMVFSLSLLNPFYVGSILPVYAIMLLMAVWAFFSSGGSLHNITLLWTCRKSNTETSS
ncbi:gamma-secretase subunit Aph-1b [Salmo salar]|uniref:Gamma-secretase subunit APH-1 n=2 Tax=Salmo TaxID=8028 RepID=A0A673Z815_SALTR|nr:gamma-secretase subunit Aph-1b-like [Salmo salar]XP_029566271.1 gamma-secretase subunit Aph-1b-like [Salmo trutta]|eukprot:XP_014000357.1 PREDICTED: gamma-secretase subunit Aph-1b-like [Salmo salar]